MDTRSRDSHLVPARKLLAKIHHELGFNLGKTYGLLIGYSIGVTIALILYVFYANLLEKKIVQKNALIAQKDARLSQLIDNVLECGKE